MRPRSWITMILGIILVVLGIVTLIIGGGAAGAIPLLIVIGGPKLVVLNYILMPKTGMNVLTVGL